MDYYDLKIGRLKRKLPILRVSPKVKVASFNLLGDRELVVVLGKALLPKLRKLDFDYLVGPEVKVVPLLEELSGLLGKPRYIVCRKTIHGYMVSPVVSQSKPGLVIDGEDANLLRGKKVIVIDDVVSSGRTLGVVAELMEAVEAKIIAYAAVFKQKNLPEKEIKDLIYLDTLPVFKAT
jgi:adenine phosphoribosyltransferase